MCPRSCGRRISFIATLSGSKATAATTKHAAAVISATHAVPAGTRRIPWIVARSAGSRAACPVARRDGVAAPAGHDPFCERHRPELSSLARRIRRSDDVRGWRASRLKTFRPNPDPCRYRPGGSHPGPRLVAVVKRKLRHWMVDVKPAAVDVVLAFPGVPVYVHHADAAARRIRHCNLDHSVEFPADVKSHRASQCSQSVSHGTNPGRGDR